MNTFPLGWRKIKECFFLHSIQHGPSQCNKAETKRQTDQYKWHPGWKGKIKLSVNTDKMIVYVENSMKCTKTLLELISKFNKFAEENVILRNQLFSYILVKYQKFQF